MFLFYFYLFSCTFLFKFLCFYVSLCFLPSVNQASSIFFLHLPQSLPFPLYCLRGVLLSLFSCIMSFPVPVRTLSKLSVGEVFMFLHFVCKCIIFNLILFHLVFILSSCYCYLFTIHTPSLNFCNLSLYWAMYIECEISENPSQFSVNAWFVVFKLDR